MTTDPAEVAPPDLQPASDDPPAAPRTGVSHADLMARNAVFTVFAAAGIAFANWLARLPAIRDGLELTPRTLGFVLMGVSAGSILTLPASGRLVDRWGTRGTVTRGALMVSAAMVVAGVAAGGVIGGVPLFVASLVVIGSGIAMWDVAMNVEGARMERVLNRAIMPWFHAAYSLGTVFGAATGALAAAVHLPVAVHFASVAVLLIVAVLWGVRHFLPPEVHASNSEAAHDSGSNQNPGTDAARSPWLEPRTLLIGLMTLGMALSEGSANDWVTLGLVDDFGLSHALGAAGLGVFLTTMTAVRFAGPWLLARFGRVPVLRVSALAVVLGLGVFVGAGEWARATGSGPSSGVSAGAGPLALAALGVALWGAGAALGFPVGMSAAADDPAHAARRVSVVATIGYVAFLAGPPLLGLAASRVGVVRSLVLVAVAATLSLVVAGAARPLTPTPAPSSDE